MFPFSLHSAHGHRAMGEWWLTSGGLLLGYFSPWACAGKHSSWWLAHHYFFLLLSGQKSRVFLKSFCVMQPKFRMDVSGKLHWHRPQEMVWATSLDLKPGSPHLPCHWHLHMQIKASATVSMQAAAALQKNRRGDMTKQVKSLATCGQQHEYNYYSVLHSWTDNFSKFFKLKQKGRNLTDSRICWERPQSFKLFVLFYFLPIQWNLSCFNHSSLAHPCGIFLPCIMLHMEITAIQEKKGQVGKTPSIFGTQVAGEIKILESIWFGCHFHEQIPEFCIYLMFGWLAQQT